jgi:hypothetical protein
MSDIIKKENSAIDVHENLAKHEITLVEVINNLGLPSNDVLVPLSERIRVFKNIKDVVIQIKPEIRKESYYISKFIAAVSSGLFDAALNYLWDETIESLRQKVANYDIDYFYDQAITNVERRKKLNSVDDLVNIMDQELIDGAKKIELISDVGYAQLDLIRYMRNYASAAHPNQNELRATQLIDWMETSIKEVILLEEPHVAIHIKRLMKNIKEHRIESEQKAKEMVAFFKDARQEQLNNLANGFFGLYSRNGTSQIALDNIKILLPLIWDLIDDETKYNFGIKYKKFVIENDPEGQIKAKEFLQICNGLGYLPEDTRILEIDETLNNLKRVHDATNNFYNEPSYARILDKLVTSPVPKGIERKYVLNLIYVAVTNGNGVTWEAEPIYFKLIQNFTAEQVSIALLSFRNSRISTKLAYSLCQKKFLEILDLLEPKIVLEQEKELLSEIKKFSASLSKLKNDTKIEKLSNGLIKLLKN